MCYREESGSANNLSHLSALALIPPANPCAARLVLGISILALLGPQPSVVSVFHAGSITEMEEVEQGMVATGEIVSAFEVDAFSFPAQQGQNYVIETGMAQGDPLEDPLLALWGTDGTSVLEVNDDYDGTFSSRIDWTAPSNGTYYLTVENADYIAKGGYTLTIRNAHDATGD